MDVLFFFKERTRFIRRFRAYPVITHTHYM